jgi:dUTP pyrophosphatase
MGVKAEMLYFDSNISMVSNCAFTIYPRSSISKTPLMLANHTGIIDAGYRGSLIGAFRWLKSNTSTETEYVVEKHTRLLQVCHPSLCPIFVVIVDENDLTSSERGNGGFGSTGV